MGKVFHFTCVRTVRLRRRFLARVLLVGLIAALLPEKVGAQDLLLTPHSLPSLLGSPTPPGRETRRLVLGPTTGSAWNWRSPRLATGRCALADGGC